MAKHQRGSARASARPSTPPPSSGKSSPSSGRSSPSSAKQSSSAPSKSSSSGKSTSSAKSASGKSSGAWQPNRVSKSSKQGGLSRTGWITIGAVIVGLLIVAFVMYQQLLSKPASSSAAIITPGNVTPATIPTNGLTLGDPNAPVTIDLWGDFRCSACFQFTEGGTAAQINSQLIATGKAKQVWHDFTVIDLHDGTTASRDAANAARCAADENKFWVMHDWLYANQSPTEDASAFTIDRLLKIGEAAGMDMTTFTPCVQNGTYNATIAQEQQNLPAGVTGTPTILVDGKVVDATFAAVEAAVIAATPSASPAVSPATSPAASPSAAPASPSPAPSASPSPSAS